MTLKPPTTFSKVAIPLREKGYAPIPIKPNSKQPAMRGWQRRCEQPPSMATLERDVDHYFGHGAGIACGNIVVIDVDCLDADRAAEAERRVRELIPGTPLKRIGQAPKFALIYRAEGRVKTNRRYPCDILGFGSQLVAYGIHPKTGEAYRWVGLSPLDVAVSELPPMSQAQSDLVFGTFDGLFESKHVATPARTSTPATTTKPGLVADGRDTVLRDMVLKVWCRGITDPDQLTAQVWLAFQQCADLRRPKRDGDTPWSEADVRDKVTALLRRAAEGKVRRGLGGSDMRYEPRFEPFMQAINAVAARRMLPPSAVTLSQVMLCLCHGDAGCFASVPSLARQIQRSEIYVKKLRARLVREGYWLRRLRNGGRGRGSEYLPCADFTVGKAETVCKRGPYITSSYEVESEAGLHSQNPQTKNSNNITISLGNAAPGGDA